MGRIVICPGCRVPVYKELEDQPCPICCDSLNPVDYRGPKPRIPVGSRASALNDLIVYTEAQRTRLEAQLRASAPDSATAGKLANSLLDLERRLRQLYVQAWHKRHIS